MRIVFLSDTHGVHWDIKVPDGDLLIHCGDITEMGNPQQIRDFDKFLGEQPHRHKVIIAGNHDFLFEKRPAQARGLITNAIYLEDSGVEIEGIKIYGSPWQPLFFNWAFNLHRGRDLAEKWKLIPKDTDVLVTHGPPSGILDTTYDGQSVGCEELRERIRVIRPKIHAFGHIHEAYGVSQSEGTQFVNCSSSYGDNPPVVVDWPISADS